MAISKKKKPEILDKDIEVLKSDVASFASSIGLATASSSLPNSFGFDDSDFRKTGTLKKPQDPSKPLPSTKPKLSTGEKSPNPQKEKNSKFQKKKEHHPIKKNEKFPSVEVGLKPQLNNLPKLPLVRASSLGVWYEDAAELERKVIGKETRIEVKNGEQWSSLVEKKKELGERLLAQFAQDFEHSRGKTGDIKMLMTTQRSGTAADKVSAFAVLIGENPIANIRSLDALLAMVTSKVGKRHALTGFEALKELFVSSLLPDRKLKSMFQRPLNHLTESKDSYSLLLFWYWEECLKQRYERFVLALEEASRDMLPILKDKALKTMYALLTSKSEQERKLLSALVNKLGDPENKGASNADYYLTNLLSVHPNMKAVVIDEVDSFLFRPHLGLRAKYHAVNFLSQIRLSHKGDGHKIAKRLVDVYFALFKVFISDVGAGKKMDKNKGDDKKFMSSHRNSKDVTPLESNAEMDSRLLSALLTGINRAFPFVANDEADDVVEVQTPMLFKLVHSKNFNIGVQALMLLDKIASKNQVVSDRFYRALYSKLLLPAAMNSSKAEMFIGLLLRAMKNDVNLKRVSAFSKRLLQVALQQPPQFACGSLFLLSEVLKARPPLWNMVLQNELIDEDIEHFEDIVEDPVSEQGTMLSEPLENTDGISCNTNADVKNDSDSSSDSEVKDGPLSDTDDSDVDLLKGGSFKDVGGVITATDVGNDQSCAPNAESLLPGGYDPRHREPSYCNADRASWWELMVLASHVHPSVATMARTLLSGANIVYNGNPLKDLSLSAFLDKFMEKKPKHTAWHGGSQIEPTKKLDMSSHLIGAEILALTEVDVPPEDLVFHKFYMNKMSSSKKTKKKKKKKGPEDEAAEDLLGVDGGNESDEEIGGIDSDDEEIDNMLDSGDKVLEADEGYDYNDLDKIANQDDDDLIGYDSDPETELLADIGVEEDSDDDDDDVPVDIGDVDDTDGDDDEVPVAMSDADDIDDEEKIHSSNKRKRNKKSGVSPFASLDEYSHLLNEDTKTKPKPKPWKKKKRTSD